jgi:hypothetical protein
MPRTIESLQQIIHGLYPTTKRDEDVTAKVLIRSVAVSDSCRPAPLYSLMFALRLLCPLACRVWAVVSHLTPLQERQGRELDRQLVRVQAVGGIAR